MRKLVAALACRVDGTRLYGKPLQLLDIESRVSILDQLIALLATEKAIEDVVLGVSEGTENEVFHDRARRHGVRSIRGDRVDVLSRLIRCGEVAGATDVFRVTTESPFPYFEAIAEAWERHRAGGNDVTVIDSVPEGSHFEIYTLDALLRSHEKGDARHRSELCSLYVREHRDEFRVDVLPVPDAVQRLDIRLTVDYPEDLVVCRRIYGHLRDLAPRIPLERTIEFVDANPDLKALLAPYVVAAKLY